jgi:endonuclease YncB( thermonuclease family)
MYKLVVAICLPLVIFAQSGKLVYIVDGDTVVLEVNNQEVVCHMGLIDAPEIKNNEKLKREMKECKFSKEEFLKAGNLSHSHAKTLLEIGITYNYQVLGYTRNKSPICKLSIPKGLHIEINPTFDELMVSRGFALPFIIDAEPKMRKLLLRVAKEAKQQKHGLWKEHKNLMQCLVEHRHSLKSLR